GVFQPRRFFLRECAPVAVLVRPLEGCDRRARPHSLQIRMAVCSAGRTPWRLLSECPTPGDNAKECDRRSHQKAYFTPTRNVRGSAARLTRPSTCSPGKSRPATFAP